MRISDWSSDVCSSDLSLPRDADIRRELARNLIAQAQAKLDARQAMADAAFGHVLKGDLGVGDRLKDQPLGDPLVIAALEPLTDVALVRQEQRPIDLEPIGGESREPQHGLRRRRDRPATLPTSGLKVEI